MIKISIIAGARPNFMKIAPIIHEIQRRSENIIKYRLIHTGQHYDSKMSNTFFEELNIPEPDVNLNCGGGSQALQTANIMVAFENELLANPADYVLVVGDVTSTMACSIVAKKLSTKVIHVEAGIRSGDLRMPEEINRIVTDSLTDVYFTTTEQASQNLINLGFDKDRIFLVGNVMIDTLLYNLNRLRKPKIWDSFQLNNGNYFVLTLHRPSNVDDVNGFSELLKVISENTGNMPIIFPMHPRTKQNYLNAGYSFKNIYVVDPMGYLEFNYLVKNAKAVITDSGGITEETTVLGIPCFTLRENTERPETVDIGTNSLIGTDPELVKIALNNFIDGCQKKGSIPEFWDGKSATRIIDTILELNG
jgi:UDP-N-acetylglucosamine 2-epimerase (non-hydrolysing)